MKKHIPNLLTSLNLFSGCVASVMAFNGDYLWVVVWVILAAVFDFFDGFMARVLNAPSLIGKELDSLADMVSFGMAPSIMCFHFLSANVAGMTPLIVINPYIPYLAFLLAVFSGLRLAKFNIDERQTSSFIGFPTPANALFWISFLYGIDRIFDAGQVPTFILAAVIVFILVFSFLMISEIPMFSLKIKHYGFKGNELRYILLVTILVASILLGILGIAIGMLVYIGLSIFSSYRKETEVNA